MNDANHVATLLNNARCVHHAFLKARREGLVQMASDYATKRDELMLQARQLHRRSYAEQHVDDSRQPNM